MTPAPRLVIPNNCHSDDRREEESRVHSAALLVDVSEIFRASPQQLVFTCVSSLRSSKTSSDFTFRYGQNDKKQKLPSREGKGVC